MNRRTGVIEFFAGHPTAANLLMLIFIVLGFIGAPQLLRQTLPDFQASEVEVVVVYPGATAIEVEQAVCRRVEDALDGVTGMEEVMSEAREGRARIVAEMVEDGDFAKFIDDVRTEVEAIDDFPAETEAPVIKELNRTDMVAAVAVAGPMSVPHLKLYCEQLKDRLMRHGDISQVDIEGFSDRQIRIEIPASALMQFGLSVSETADVISRQSVDLPAGSLETVDGDIVVRFADERRRVAEFRDLVVFSGITGAEIKLGDIARIADRFETDEDKLLFNGQRAGLLMIKKTKEQDALRVMEDVEDFLELERRRAPPDVTLALTQNVTEIISDRLGLLLTNGLQGLVLVFGVMWLFFNIRMSFWVTMGLPVAFLGALFAMFLAGLSLNMLSMVGLLLAIGLIMDDAIVIAENVAAHLHKGKSALRAAVDGTREVTPGVMSSFATTLFIFGSVIVLIEGDIGKVLWVMPLVLIMTLGVSLVEAFLILPNHLAHSLAHRPTEGSGFRRRFDAWFDRVREERLGPFVDWAIRWRYFFIGCVVSLLLASFAMLAGGKLKLVAFPDLEGDVLEARLLLPQGTPLERTETMVARLVLALDEVNGRLTPLQDDGRPLVENVTVQYNKNVDANEVGAHVATVVADLLGSEERSTNIDELSALWAESVGELPDVLSLTFKEPSLGPAGLDIDLRLQGEDLDQLKRAAVELTDWLNGYEGVLYLMDDLRPGKPEVRVRLREGAATLGLDAGMIGRQLRAAFHGQEAAEIQVGSESYEVDVRLDPADKDSIGDLEYFTVTTPEGALIPLNAVAELEEGRGVARIVRYDSLRTVSVQGDVDGRVANASQIVGDTMARFIPGLLERYPGVSVDLSGAAKEGPKTGKSMIQALGIGALGIFVLLSFQFRSYVEPFVVITAIPLAFIGVVWGHLLIGVDLSMPSVMGFVSLAGVVVNDSILLVTFLKLHMQDGQSAAAAAAQASRLRFRAVTLTSLTTIMGLLPLLTEQSLQAQILIPLACSLIFGMVASTFLVLTVVPCLYAILDDWGLARGGEDTPAAMASSAESGEKR